MSYYVAQAGLKFSMLIWLSLNSWDPTASAFWVLFWFLLGIPFQLPQSSYPPLPPYTQKHEHTQDYPESASPEII